MAQIPLDAQRSPDGHYWWDAASNEWKLVSEHEEGATSAPGSENPSESSAASGEPTPEELTQVSEDHVPERLRPYYAPSQEPSVDLSAAEIAAVLSDEPAPGHEEGQA